MKYALNISKQTIKLNENDYGCGVPYDALTRYYNSMSSEVDAWLYYECDALHNECQHFNAFISLGQFIIVISIHMQCK